MYLLCLFHLSACSIIEGLAVTANETDSSKDTTDTTDNGRDTQSDSVAPGSDDTASETPDAGKPQETDVQNTDAGNDTDSGDTDTNDTSFHDTDSNDSDTADAGDTDRNDTEDVGDAGLTDAGDGGTEPPDTDTEGPLTMVPIPFSNCDDIFACIDAAENDIGLKGWWNAYPMRDTIIPGLPYISMDPYTPDVICVEGTVYETPPGGDPNSYFGAKVGFETCAVGGPPGSSPRTVYSLGGCITSDVDIPLNEIIVGFTFTLTGELPEYDLRVQFGEHDRQDGTYVEFQEPQPGSYEVRFEEAALLYDPTAAPINIANVTEVLFYIPSTRGTTSFNFCIEDVNAVVRPL